MPKLKDTERSTVHVGFDGRVRKSYRGAMAFARLANEVRVLEYLAARECPFVPRVLSVDTHSLELEITHCGIPIEWMGDDRLHEIFAELEAYGVQHRDPFMRNVTYDAASGHFFVIDFEFAVILETGEGLIPEAVGQAR